jgi:hypothetical protein
VDLGDFMAGPFPGKHFPPSGVILSQPGRIIKKETVYPQIAQRRAAATKEFYRDTDEHGSTRIIPEEKDRNREIVPREGVKKSIWPFSASFRRRPESSVFTALRIDWTPVFTGVTNKI